MMMMHVIQSISKSPLNIYRCSGDVYCTSRINAPLLRSMDRARARNRTRAHTRRLQTCRVPTLPLIPRHQWNRKSLSLTGSSSQSDTFSSAHSRRSSSVSSTQLDEWRAQIESLLDRGLIQDAQAVYDQTAAANVRNDENTSASDRVHRASVQERLSRSWIVHQQETLDLRLRPVPSVSSSSSSSSQSSEQAHTLNTIVYAAKMAHNLLEQMEPLLGAKSVVWQTTRRTSDIDGTDVRPGKRAFDPLVTQRCDEVLAAWAKAVRAVHQSDAPRALIRAIPQRAQFLLERMEAAYDSKSNTTTGIATKTTTTTTTIADSATLIVQPSIQSYNRVLESWAYSQEHLRGTSSERLFQKITTDKADTPAAAKLVRPNTETYRLMVWAWAQSRDQRAAFTATGYLMKMLRRMELGIERENDDLDSYSKEPTIADYHVVFRAWVRSEEKASPGKAHSLLKLTTEAFKKGLTMTQPDETCHRLVLQTAAQRPYLLDLGPLVVDDTLKKMRENFMVPDSKCYTAAIRTWKNAALHQPDVSAVDQQTSVRRAMELLAEMEVAHNQSTSVSVTISTSNINDVLEALSVSANPRRADQADDLLAKLERGSSEANASLLFPNAESYLFAMKVWGTVDSLDKITRSKEILDRAIANRSNIVGLSSKKEQVVALFNMFVSVCGSYKASTEREAQDVLKEALDAFQTMRTLDTLEPNSETYATLMDACAKLLPQGRERRVALETIFKLSCDDGLVNESVLTLLRKIAPSDLFAELVLTASESVEGTKVVPEAWTRKALGGKVVSTDGRKTTPLSVDGRLQITMAMKEFKMRRLRDRRNQKLLRGGRLRIEKEPEQSPWRLYNNA